MIKVDYNTKLKRKCESSPLLLSSDVRLVVAVHRSHHYSSSEQEHFKVQSELCLRFLVHVEFHTQYYFFHVDHRQKSNNVLGSGWLRFSTSPSSQPHRKCSCRPSWAITTSLDFNTARHPYCLPVTCQVPTCPECIWVRTWAFSSFVDWKRWVKFLAILRTPFRKQTEAEGKNQ